ncbi:thiamine biosynthesis lipoprotein [Devosia enhydra]|uniref:FAD:protein FMN transferase n=1 Tax=Devosia enhydra TaxID=665118 RepID=A0A1K2HTX1_9HYPH|nr:FAD:protein FMN transferase [Devosia enhydra]SFZ80836.1 thiamine biosynthesis lipoprotein [Devosia enhydra]
MAITRRNLLLGLAGMTTVAALPASAGARDAVRLSGWAFGTGWSVTLPRGIGPEEPAAIAETLAGIDAAMSPFRPDSVLSRFNRASAGSHVVDRDFASVTAEALRLAAWSDGAFDPTVGPLVGRYGFGPMHGERGGNYKGLTCIADRVGKAHAAMSLDLCGIAKGHAVDAVAARLRRLGHSDMFIEIGGEVLAGSVNDGPAWRVGIANPQSGGVACSFPISDLAIATSGDSINVYEVDGRRYSHTIDPGTAEPVLNRVASVSVAHRSAMTADGLATAMMVMGPETGLARAHADGLAVLFLLRDPAEGLIAQASPAWLALSS